MNLAALNLIEISWRRHEPTEPNSRRWSLVHITSPSGDFRTLCGVDIDTFNYDEARGEWVPRAARRCKRCAKLAAKLLTPVVEGGAR